MVYQQGGTPVSVLMEIAGGYDPARTPHKSGVQFNPLFPQVAKGEH
jgi:hypothetical protein